ncbi:hypothetical protein GCM10011579_005750 [Streptomyces albiflavescens]|uniref:Uncharacterized protein n=1 Tax=Streptomyces albiflavescens TaxID=1623582 RepID=A0A917XTD5_9ACTN|nr:hypothetical protein GCM10011579_005750 [Streptomyces albiflavescens]
MDALRKAVERAGHEQDVHGDLLVTVRAAEMVGHAEPSRSGDRLSSHPKAGAAPPPGPDAPSLRRTQGLRRRPVGPHQHRRQSSAAPPHPTEPPHPTDM